MRNSVVESGLNRNVYLRTHGGHLLDSVSGIIGGRSVQEVGGERGEL